MVSFFLTLLVVLSMGYYLGCMAAARRFFSQRPSIPPGAQEPVSILIPLCGTDYEAYENHATFCRQVYPSYQIIFGVQDGTDPAVDEVRRLMADFPEKDIRLVVGKERIGQNPKVNNLHNMLTGADHELLVLVDSDIRVHPDYLSEIVSAFGDERVGLVTCLYRAGKAPDIASRIEAIGMTAEFAPGVLMAWLTEGISFALGATVAMRRSRLTAIGGLEAVADYLADDYMLGNLMRRAGFEVRLSSTVVETLQPAAHPTGMLKHQIRWSRGIRACRPWGHLGSILTHGTSLALLNVLARAGDPFSLLLLTAAFTARFLMAWHVGVRFLGDAILARSLWLLPVRDFLSFFVWCAALTGKKVVWRNREYLIVEDGKIIPLG